MQVDDVHAQRGGADENDQRNVAAQVKRAVHSAPAPHLIGGE